MGVDKENSTLKEELIRFTSALDDIPYKDREEY